MDKVSLPPPPRKSAGCAPPRAPGSARRTSSIDVCWPEGRTGDAALTGRARDIVTPRSSQDPIICAEDSFQALVKQDRTIVAIITEPERPNAARLIGKRGGGHLRHVLDEVMPEERRNATPLYLILDDISGTSLVSGWAWSQWDDDWLAAMRRAANDPNLKSAFNMEGVCIGFAPGSSALGPERFANPSGGAPAPDLRCPDDPEGWHAFTQQESVGMRRARRIDVTLGAVVHVDAAFQDSATTRNGGRMALHEYRLTMTADLSSLRILSIEADPRVLPFPECPSAKLNLSRLVGAPLGELRERVLAELRGTAGCTHLNDALRALAEVPTLVRYLQHYEGGQALAG